MFIQWEYDVRSLSLGDGRWKDQELSRAVWKQIQNSHDIYLTRDEETQKNSFFLFRVKSERFGHRSGCSRRDLYIDL